MKNIASCLSCDIKLNMFCHMTDNQLNNVNDHRKEVRYKAGETIFKTGGPLTHMICLTKGMVKVYLEDPYTDKRILLSILKPVELVLGPGFLVDNSHHLTAVAMEETTACFINIEEQKSIMESNTKYTMAILEHVNKKVIKQFEKMQCLTHKHTHGKMADALLYLANAVYENDVFDTLLSRQDLADLSAMTKETTIRLLKEFSDEGIIKCEQNHFEILNKEKLEKISISG
ncbi:Crp/Fnr family transcriptional regulator [Lentimicrobium sp. S6]|uniref:Crp/Fnr family transcriptional regulator n=1 Tax=Lentimicrobium sp. S6 TaxID=2735872 RepID=UPI001556A665|nr:Crp/Fnr family transcriptional regulator [Lentimicrobium sp. S6]NPD45624.1 Crp/Fnr family transcriptional regulator [Lentimicrobium sp. S6]